MKKLVVAAFAIALAGVFSMPAAAADWDMYGSARMKTFWESEDASASDTGYQRTETIWTLQGNSRIGATVKQGNIGGRFEYGTGVNVRRLYGTWDFGKGTLLVGKEYTPLDFTISSQVARTDLTLNGYGTTFSRKPMLQLEMMGFAAALVEPGVDDLGGTANGVEDVQVVLPSIEASYTYKADQFYVEAIAGYSIYQVVNSTNEKDSVNRYILGVAGSYDIGPAYISAQFQFGQNLGTWGIVAAFPGAANADPIYVDGSVKNNFGYGFAGEAGFVLSETMRFAAGIGGVSYKIDESGYEDDQAFSYYLNAKFNVTPTAFVVPEIGLFDNVNDETGNSQGVESYLGAKWQIDF